MNYAPVPKKYLVKYPIYETNQKCELCGNSKVTPIMNMIGSPLLCSICDITFKANIIGYKEVEEEERPVPLYSPANINYK
jgi:hypothetical protein